MALYLRGFCGNPVDKWISALWIKMWKIGQVFCRHNLTFPPLLRAPSDLRKNTREKKSKNFNLKEKSGRSV